MLWLILLLVVIHSLQYHPLFLPLLLWGLFQIQSAIKNSKCQWTPIFVTNSQRWRKIPSLEFAKGFLGFPSWSKIPSFITRKEFLVIVWNSITSKLQVSVAFHLICISLIVQNWIIHFHCRSLGLECLSICLQKYGDSRHQGRTPQLCLLILPVVVWNRRGCKILVLTSLNARLKCTHKRASVNRSIDPSPYLHLFEYSTWLMKILRSSCYIGYRKLSKSIYDLVLIYVCHFHR